MFFSKKLILPIALLTLTACVGPNANFKPAHNYKEVECKSMFNRGEINLEQRGLCLKGQAFKK